MSGCFDFRIIKQDDGTEIFDTSCKTPYDSLTPVQMQEYIEADSQIAYMESIKRKEKRKHRKEQRNPFYKLAVLCEIL